jgi:hypothetical protein
MRESTSQIPTMLPPAAAVSSTSLLPADDGGGSEKKAAGAKTGGFEKIAAVDAGHESMDGLRFPVMLGRTALMAYGGNAVGNEIFQISHGMWLRTLMKTSSERTGGGTVR